MHTNYVEEYEYILTSELIKITIGGYRVDIALCWPSCTDRSAKAAIK